MKPVNFKSFEEVLAFMTNKKSGQRRLNVGVSQRNTLLQARDLGPDGEVLSVALRVHKTDVLLFTPEGVTFNNGGWMTVLTKRRMNQWGPIRVYSHEREWYVSNRMGETVEYRNGMVVGYDGTIVSIPSYA